MANQDWYDYEANEGTSGRKRLAPKPPPLRLRPPSGSVRQSPFFFLVIFIFSAVTLAVGLPVGLGVIVGLRDRDELVLANAEDHYQRAVQYDAENYPDLALAELQLALRYNPNYEPARQKLVELQTRSATMTSQGPLNVAAQLYKQATQSLQDQNWDDAINEFEEVRRVDPEYLKPDVARYLYQAYVGGGKIAVAVGNIELARQRFENALGLQPNDPFALQQRDLARAYLLAQESIGYDWGTAVTNFQKVYQADPNYYDVKKQLVNALLGNGDLAAKRGAWCIAAREYDRANQISPTPNLAANVSQANANCVAAVLNPTAIPTATPNPLATATLPPPPSIIVGEELYAAQKIIDMNAKCSGTGAITGAVHDNANHPLAGIPVKYDNLLGVFATTRTNADGTYSFILGKDAGVFYVAIVTADGKTTQSQIVDINYPGGNTAGCRIVLNWTRIK